MVYGGLLGEQPDDESALAGAGEAAFAEGKYREAVAYFTRASRGGLLPADSADRLATARLVVAGDPLQPGLTGLERRRRTLRALATAVARLDGCAAQPGTAASLQEVTADAATLRDRVTARTLARDPDLMELALSLVWRIELQTAEVCGAPGGIDAALLLVARQRQGASP